MNRVKYNRYVQKIEQKFEGRPDALARRALLYIAGSYLYISVVILTSVGLLAGLIYSVIFQPKSVIVNIGLTAIGIGIFSLIQSIFKGLNVKTLDPEGIPITRRDAPQLFTLLDDLRHNVANAKFDRVIINGEFNAAVYQTPRLGIPGWNQNCLILGLPLMQTLNRDEIKAVLAHEFSHLCNKDGALSNWIYRIRLSWEQIMTAIFASGSSGSSALAPFLNWFWPRFNGHAFALSRLNEYRADATAANYAGKEVVRTSLQRVEQYGRLIEEITWSSIFELANDTDTPPDTPYDQIKQAVESPIDPQLGDDWLAQSYARPTDYSDTHPALSDRLKYVDALPQNIALLPPNPESAAIELLGAGLERELLDQLNKDWRDSLIDLWKERFEEVQEIRKELGNESEVNDADSAWKWAETMLNLKGAEDAIHWVEKTLAFDPDHIGGRYSKGCYLIDKNDPAGVPLLEAVIEQEPMLGLEALGMLKMYYSNIGDTRHFNDIDRRADEFENQMEKAQNERSAVSKSDTFFSHSMGSDKVGKVSVTLGEFDYIKTVHMAQKQVVHFPASPMYIVIVTLDQSSADNSTTDFIAECLAPLMDGAFFVLMKNDNKSVARKISELPNSLIFAKESQANVDNSSV